jgi:hypothetical protein
MHNTKYLRFVFAIVSATSVFAQKPITPDQIVAFNITVNFDEYTVKTQMLKDPKKIKVDNELSYLWYNSNKIIETKGGYDGKLLHGYYKSFYLNNQLRESGEIKYGIKTGEWRNWYSDGKLKEVSTWKKGRKNGTYELYNDYGHLMAKGAFKNDLLNGKFYTYDDFGNIRDSKKYRNGVEVQAQPNKKFFELKFKSLFKRNKRKSKTAIQNTTNA